MSYVDVFEDVEHNCYKCDGRGKEYCHCWRCGCDDEIKGRCKGHECTKCKGSGKAITKTLVGKRNID